MTALLGLAAKLRLARTLVTTHTRHDDMTAFAAAVYDAGADIVVLRDTEASEGQAAAVEAAQRVALGRNALVAVTDAALAQAVQADVLLCGSFDAARAARGTLHEHALVGAGVYSVDDLRRVALGRGVDLALVGPVHLPPGSAVPAPGLDLVRAAAAELRAGDPRGTPWFAVGGLSADRLGEVIGAGARRVGVVVGGTDDLDLVRTASDALRRSWADDPALTDFAFAVLSGGAA